MKIILWHTPQIKCYRQTVLAIAMKHGLNGTKIPLFIRGGSFGIIWEGEFSCTVRHSIKLANEDC
jgi:hypothetical protein